MANILIAGGGTGGHAYPALAIGKELKHRNPQWNIEFAGRNDLIEGRIVPLEGFKLHEVYVEGFERYYSPLRKAKVAARAALSFFQSFRLLSKFKADCVVGTGGYTCGPIVLAAHMKGLPTLICEQNVIPGFTIKSLSKVADKVCLSFADAKEYMAKPDRCIFTGNPVRREFALFNRGIARNSMGLEDDELLMLSFGGSLGARTINNAIAGALPFFAANPKFKLVHITGRGQQYAEFMGDVGDIPKNATIIEYSNDMPMLMNAADLVLSRSGASSVSEINYVGVASVYVPFPAAVFDHQTKNAQVCVDKGASILIEDSKLDAESLVNHISSLIDTGILAKMAAASKSLGILDSAEMISLEIEKLVATV
ncbi:MAG: undecaprenyldiphospho-muramoylpentapeptide beta-N-acetylglucosaminyltransferase [Eubacteriaceae bacterium]|nr:undecaprenyldiphospho-muramoylpentapeptide beta-N-acetylglucosaminyltransferase [Eubacteriaceae bacterium]